VQPGVREIHDVVQCRRISPDSPLNNLSPKSKSYDKKNNEVKYVWKDLDDLMDPKILLAMRRHDLAYLTYMLQLWADKEKSQSLNTFQACSEDEQKLLARYGEKYEHWLQTGKR
jgi:non-ribosomal peptide synthetase component F